GVADGLVDGLGHHGTAIHLLEVAHRPLAWAKAVETELFLEIGQTGVRLGIEIRCGNVNLEFVLQSLSEGFCDLHGVNLLPAWSGLNGTNAVNLVDAWLSSPASVVRRPNPPGRFAPAELGAPVIVIMQTPSALGGGGGPRPPKIFVPEPKTQRVSQSRPARR